MAKDDPLGDWAPTLALLGGAGITGYRAAKEFAAKGSISAPWQRAKDTQQSLQMLRSGVQVQRDLSKQIYTPAGIGGLYFPTSQQMTFAGIGRKDKASVLAAGEEYAYQATRGFLRSNALEQQFQQKFGFEFGRGTFTQQVFQDVMEMHPKGAEHFQRRAQSYGLPELMDPVVSKGADGRVLPIHPEGSLEAGLQRREKKGRIQNIRGGAELTRVSDLGKVPDALMPGRRIGMSAVPESLGGIKDTLRSSRVGSEALAIELQKLNERVAQMKGVDIKLMTLQQGADRSVLSGVRITSERNGAFLDIPFEQKGGVVHLGEFGERRGVTRRVSKGASELRQLVARGEANQVHKLSNPLSLHTMQQLNSSGEKGLHTLLSDAPKGEVKLDIYKLAQYGDDTGAAVLQHNMNEGLNTRISQQMTMTHIEGVVGFEDLKHNLGAAMSEVVNPYGGLGPAHHAKPILNLGGTVEQGGRVAGSSELGQWVGDPKGQAQAMRETGFFESEWKGRGKGDFVGRLQKGMGDKLPELRVANIRGGLLEGFMAGDQRYAHMALSSDELFVTEAVAQRKHLRSYTAAVSDLDEQGRMLAQMTEADRFRMREMRDQMTQGRMTEAEVIKGRAAARHQAQMEVVESLKDRRQGATVRRAAQASTNKKRSSTKAERRAKRRAKRKAARKARTDAALPKPAHSGLSLRPPQSVLERAGDMRVAEMSRVEAGGRLGFDLPGKEVGARGGQTIYIRDAMIHEGQLKVSGFSATEGGVSTKVFGDLKHVQKYTNLDPATGREWAAVQEMLVRDPKELARIEAMESAGDRARALAPWLTKVREGTSIDVMRALHTVGDVEGVGLAGVKSLSERGLAPMTRSMTSELVGLHGRAAQAGQAGEAAWARGELEKIGATLDPKTGSFQIEDAVLKAENAKYNQIARFDSLAESFSEFAQRPGDTGPVSVGRARWTRERFVADLQNANNATNDAIVKQGGTVTEEMTKAQTTQIQGLKEATTFQEFKAAAGEKFRPILGGQLGYGTWNYSAAVEGRAAQRLGTGRQASMSGQVFGHLKSQNTVMARAAEELMQRTQGQFGAARELSKALAYAGEANPVPHAVSMLDERMPMGAVPRTAEALRDSQKAGIFSLNQEVRSKSAAQIREAFGMKAGADIVFDMGEGRGGRNLYYIEEQFDKLTRGQRLADESASLGRYDRTLAGALQAEGGAAAQAAHETHQARLLDLASHKGGVLSEIDKGKVVGSRQLQAASGLSEELTSYLGKQGQVGVFESQVRGMATELGADPDDYIKSLRRGEEAALLHRWPMSEQLRAMPAQAFSMDQAILDYSRQKEAQLVRGSGEEALKFYESIESSRKRVNVLKARALEIEGKPLTGQNLRNAAGSVLTAEDIAESLIRNMGKSAQESAFFALDDATKMAILTSTGTDFDADQVGITLFRDKELRSQAAALSRHNREIVEGLVRDSKLPAAERVGMDQVLTAQRAKAGIEGPNAIYDMAERQAAYQYQREALFQELQRVQTPLTTEQVSAVDTAAGRRNTAEAMKRMEAEALMGRLEKRAIGPLTNQVDFTRAVFREGVGTGGVARASLMGEILLGQLPEVALKARQGGTAQAKTLTGEVEAIVSTLRGEGGIVAERAQRFEQAFRNLHKEGIPKQFLDSLFADDIAKELMHASDKASKRGESMLHKMVRLPKGVEAGSAERLMEQLSDVRNTNLTAALYQEAAGEATGREASRIEAATKRGTQVFDDFWKGVAKHKRPALIGAGVAVAASMLFGSPGHISEEEAVNAGARHHGMGNPAHPQIDTGNSARLRSGTSVRVRGQSAAEMDYQQASSAISSAYPGADVVYNINDQGSNVDREYVRKLLERG